MVRIPKFYIKFEQQEDNLKVLISEFSISGFYSAGDFYISAYNSIENKNGSIRSFSRNREGLEFNVIATNRTYEEFSDSISGIQTDYSLGNWGLLNLMQWSDIFWLQLIESLSISSFIVDRSVYVRNNETREYSNVYLSRIEKINTFSNPGRTDRFGCTSGRLSDSIGLSELINEIPQGGNFSAIMNSYRFRGIEDLFGDVNYLLGRSGFSTNIGIISLDSSGLNRGTGFIKKFLYPGMIVPDFNVTGGSSSTGFHGYCDYTAGNLIRVGTDWSDPLFSGMLDQKTVDSDYKSRTTTVRLVFNPK